MTITGHATGETHVSHALLDLDRFKPYNDEYGHAAGDAVLREIATEWGTILRAGDVVARYGGEEFALAFPAWSLETALTVVDRLRDGGCLTRSRDESVAPLPP